MISPVIISFLRHLLPMLPAAWRIALYERLMAQAPYGPTNSRRCLKIFQGLYVKHDERCEAEAKAMQLVERYTRIPIPRVVDLVKDSDGKWYLLMSEIPGTPFATASGARSFSKTEMNLFTSQLRHWMDELRTIPPSTTLSVCSPGGSHILSARYGFRPIGPFNSLPEFHADLFKSFSSYDLMMPDMRRARSILSRHNQVVFTHGDLLPHNVMIHQGRLSGIIDWETAGWLPAYWEYNTIHFPRGPHPRSPWHIVVAGAMPSYMEEFKAEREIWIRRV